MKFCIFSRGRKSFPEAPHHILFVRTGSYALAIHHHRETKLRCQKDEGTNPSNRLGLPPAGKALEILIGFGTQESEWTPGLQDSKGDR